MSTPTWNNPVVKWIDYRLPIFTFVHHDLVEYPTPRNLNYWVELRFSGRGLVGCHDRDRHLPRHELCRHHKLGVRQC